MIYFDTEHMIKNYSSDWRNNFTFLKAKLTNRAFQRIKRGFVGTVKPGKEIIFSKSKLIELTALENSIDFNKKKENVPLAAQTFKVQLTFDFQTQRCFDILELFQETDYEFFE